MNALSSILKIAPGLLALALLVVPSVRAAEDMAPPKKLTKNQEQYDADHDGRLNADEIAAAKAGAAAKAKATREANLAKYDTNHDGKYDDAERAVRQADELAEKEAMQAAKAAEKAAGKKK